nr:ATP-binding cassette domain-containing protein [Amycolatopsis tolypomycina]
MSFELGAGEIVGLLGPNGLGKTTIVECVQACAGPTAVRSTSSAPTLGTTRRGCAVRWVDHSVHGRLRRRAAARPGRRGGRVPVDHRRVRGAGRVPRRDLADGPGRAGPGSAAVLRLPHARRGGPAARGAGRRDVHAGRRRSVDLRQCRPAG